MQADKIGNVTFTGSIFKGQRSKSFFGGLSFQAYLAGAVHSEMTGRSSGTMDLHEDIGLSARD